MNINLLNKSTRAEKIYDYKNRLISPGKKKKRTSISLLGEEKTYDIACKTIGKNRVKDGKQIPLNFFEKRFWTPLKLKDDKYVLLNINSLSKRTGISKDKLLQFAEEGDFNEVKNEIENFVTRKKQLTKQLKMLSVDKDNISDAYNALLGFKYNQTKLGEIDKISDTIFRNLEKFKNELNKEKNDEIEFDNFTVTQKGIKIKLGHLGKFLTWEQLKKGVEAPTQHSEKLKTEFREVQDSDLEGKKIVRRTPKEDGFSVGEEKEITVTKNTPYYPKYRFKIGETTYYISEPFIAQQLERPVVYALIETDEKEKKLHGQPLYLSNSQGIWRIIPTEVKRGENNDLGHICKGKQESDTAAPAALNILLMKLMDQKGKLETIPLPSDLVQTSPFWMQGIHTQKYEQIIQPLYDQKLVEIKELQKDNLSDELSYPDYSTYMHYELDNKLYGKVCYYLYSSKDKKFLWTFCELKSGPMKGKVFLANVDYHESPITSYGNRKIFVPDKRNDMDVALTAPLAEYPRQIKSDFYPNDFDQYVDKKWRYQWNWNYVRTNPLVKDWYEKHGLPLPETI